MKKIVTICVVGVFAFGALLAQTNVDPGDNTLSAAIAAAAPGDMLVLADGGIYTETTLLEIPINKSIMILAEAGAVEKPILKSNAVQAGGEDAPRLFLLQNGADITLEGIEIDGGASNVTTFLPMGDVFRFEALAGNAVISVKLLSCWIHGYTNEMLDGNSSDYTGLALVIGSVVIDDCMFMAGDGISGDGDGVAVFKRTGITSLTVTNTTVWHGNDKLFRTEDDGEPYFSDPVIVFDHCTFVDVAHRFFQFRDGVGSPIVIKNSIFADNSAAGRDRAAIQVQDNPSVMINNCCFFNITNADGPIDVVEGALVADNIEVDPLFADAANADFTLLEGSPCIGAADDGKAMGDPRWDPNATAVEDGILMPSEYSLGQNYPNPFNPTTTIDFTLKETGHTLLTVYNVMGQKVKTLVDGQMAAGVHEITLNASDLESGMYFYEIRSGEYASMKKMVLMK
ncbi:hypothetical protein BVY01_01800 [bacterium I07]|nr:hypothetical protein BVY01_01800 [bacterium I07]